MSGMYVVFFATVADERLSDSQSQSLFRVTKYSLKPASSAPCHASKGMIIDQIWSHAAEPVAMVKLHADVGIDG